MNSRDLPSGSAGDSGDDPEEIWNGSPAQRAIKLADGCFVARANETAQSVTILEAETT